VRLCAYYDRVRERLDDPIVRMVVAAGTSRDLREFWTAVAYILSLARRATFVAIDYSDRWGTGSVRLGAESEAGDPPHTETWREGDDRFVRLSLAPQPPGDEPLERELHMATELSALVGRRAFMEHERRIGIFLVELSRWARTAAVDPRELLHYTVQSVLALAAAHGALVIERAANGALGVVAAVGATDMVDTTALDRSIFSRVALSGDSVLTDRLGDEADLPVAAAARPNLAAAMIVPLTTSGEPAGVLAVHRLRDRPRGDERFDIGDLANLQAVAAHIGGALELSWAIRAARQAAVRASAMVNGSPLPLALLTRAGRVLEANPAFATLFGFEELERVRDQHLDAFPLVLDRATPLEAMDLAASGIPWRGRARVLRPADGERLCDAFFTFLGDVADPAPAGEAGEILLAITDRTDELRARRDLVAREKLTTVGTLAAGVAHEVNNPLAIIRMEAELLGLQHTAPEIVGASQAIIREVDRAARIAKSLLRLAAQSHGRMEEVDVVQLLGDMVAVRAPLVLEVGVHMRVASEGRIPRVLARGGDLEQIFIHLLTNAEDAVQGHQRQEIEVRASSSPDGVRVTVDDSGPGIPPEQRNRVFDPFFTTKPPDRSSGLGLAMCHRIVSELGGRIWAEESPLGGARLVVELPGASGRGPASADRRLDRTVP
jgi:signal transduction histidine kinase